MKLILNTSYPIERGFLVPRSHARGDTLHGNVFLIVQILERTLTGFKTYYTTMTSKEIKKELKLKKTERLEIL